MTASSAHRIVLGAEADVWRRQLGPSAWCLLETLAARAHEHDGDLVAHVSIRSLSGLTGAGHNTVDRALRRLQAAGIVHRLQARGQRGAFDRGTYVLQLPSDALVVERAASTRRAGPKAPQAAEQQVLLLDADGVEEDVGGYATSFDRQVPTGRS